MLFVMLNYCIVGTKCCSLTILELSFNGEVLLIRTHKWLKMHFNVLMSWGQVNFSIPIFFAYKHQWGVFELTNELRSSVALEPQLTTKAIVKKKSFLHYHKCSIFYISKQSANTIRQVVICHSLHQDCPLQNAWQQLKHYAA